MITVGTFRRVVKKDGTMLFKPAFRDHDFLEDINYLIHKDLETIWNIENIRKIAKGFHIKLEGVDNSYQSGFFIDEEFSLPDEMVAGKTIDLVIGEEVYDHKDEVIGKVAGLSSTPAYTILEIEKMSGETDLIPFTEEFFEEDGTKIKLRRKES